MFCNNCGGQLQQGAANCTGCGAPVQAQPQAPQAAAPQAIICPNCKAVVPAGGMVCTACGTLVSNSGGSAIKLPENLNANNIIKISKDIAEKAGMSVHRLYIAILALLGILGCLLPWYGAGIFGIRVSVNAFRAKASMGGFGSDSEIHLLGIIVFIMFIAIIAVCFLESRVPPLKQFGKFAIAGASGLALLLACIRLFGEASDVGIKFGLILVVLMAIACGAAPFIKQLEKF
jgi:hypothetical protein